MVIFLLIAALFLFLILLYGGKGYWAWVLGAALALFAWWVSGIEHEALFRIVVVLGLVVAAIFGLPALRRGVISNALMGLAAKAVPAMGATEREALEAGSVWWDGDLFSGKPDWDKLLAFRPQPLSEAEQAFLDGPVEEACAMIDDWEIGQNRDLPDAVWDFFKEHRFLGMIIPTEYGGLGFSAYAHSQVITKLSSRSSTAAVIVMVPNSLGPAELILHYGTESQKDHYLPRLASGDDIPCFALTEPAAGSDAAATRATGVVCRDQFDGEEVLGLRLNWAKRYITLSSVATVVGLAFRCLDPDGLLGGAEDRGITCALIPAGLPGIDIGQRHDPMGIPFPNGPVFGRDVFVPLDFVIGGEAGVGNGWRMLMQSLAAGRSVSLPSLSVGAAQLAVRVAGAHGTVREQFNLPIGRFEGIEEPLARIGGHAYLMDAARRLTCAAVDGGESPAVLSAIVKAYLTEAMRRVINDALDIRGGAAISRGPRNILSSIYRAIPIGITVEGANILTRTLIVYGQGAVRSHPFVRAEMEAIETQDLAAFDLALFGHISLVARNKLRAVVLAWSAGYLAPSPVAGPTGRYFQKLSRFSAAFALISDMSLAVLGGALKRKEKLSGRLADALAWMYLGSATLKRFIDEGQPERDAAVMRYAAELSLANIETALRGVLRNFPNRPLARTLEFFLFTLAPACHPPSDDLGGKVASALLDDGELRRHLSRDIYIPPAQQDGLGKLEAALAKIMEARPVGEKMKAEARLGSLRPVEGQTLAEAALAAGVIVDSEYELWIEAEAVRDEIIQVDAFDAQTYAAMKG